MHCMVVQNWSYEKLCVYVCAHVCLNMHTCVCVHAYLDLCLCHFCTFVCIGGSLREEGGDSLCLITWWYDF